MKLSEAIRVAEKAKGWLDRFPEYRAAVDELIKLARTQTGEPTPKPEPSGFGRLLADVRSEVVKSWDEFTDSVFDLPPCTDDPAPAPEVGQKIAVNDLVNDRAGFGTISTITPGGYRVVVVEKWDDPAPEPTPAAPKPGDIVPDREAAIKLPEGTLLADRSGRGRGLVVRGTVGPLVRWASPGEEQYPATIVDVNVP